MSRDDLASGLRALRDAERREAAIQVAVHAALTGTRATLYAPSAEGARLLMAEVAQRVARIRRELGL